MDKSLYQNSGKIRIAYVLRSKHRGGVEEHVLSLVRRLNPERFKIFVIAPPELIESFGEGLASTAAKTFPLEIRGVFDFKSMYVFVKFLWHHGIHIVNTHMFIASAYFSPLSKLARVPVLLETSHGVEKWRLEKGYFKRKSFCIDWLYSRLQNKILAVSHACCNDLVNIKKIQREKIIVVQNGRDLNDFTPCTSKKWAEMRGQYGFVPDDYVFGVLARLDFQKGHRYLFEAVNILSKKRKDFKLLIVGDGPLREDLHALVRKLTIEQYVIFAGFQKDMPAYHCMLDVNILPSLYEGLPLGLIEASAMEKPVIATAVDGTPEVILDGETGLLVPSKNPVALCEAMEYALEHKEEMKIMGKRGREFALKNFTLQRQVNETEQVYEKLIAVKFPNS